MLAEFLRRLSDAGELLSGCRREIRCFRREAAVEEQRCELRVEVRLQGPRGGGASGRLAALAHLKSGFDFARQAVHSRKCEVDHEANCIAGVGQGGIVFVGLGFHQMLVEDDGGERYGAQVRQSCAQVLRNHDRLAGKLMDAGRALVGALNGGNEEDHAVNVCKFAASCTEQVERKDVSI